MSNSVRPHRQQPTRLPCPWDSPGKNTGVGCHFLLQCINVKSESENETCPTLSDPMDCSLPVSSIHGIFQARVLEWVAIAFSNISQHQSLFQWVNPLHQVAKVMELLLQHQSFQWIFRIDFLYDWLVWSPCNPRDSQESSPVPQFKGISSLVLSLLYSPTLTSLHDYRKNNSFDYTDLCRQSDVSAF